MLELPETAERARIIAHHIVKIPEWASFTSVTDASKKLRPPQLWQCAALPGHIRSLTPLDPTTPSGFSDTVSFKGMLFSSPMFMYDAEIQDDIVAWGLLRKKELSSHKNILSVFSAHGLPVEKIVHQYALDNFFIFDRVTKQKRILSEEEFISRLRLEFAHILKNTSPEDGFRIISDPGLFAGRDSKVKDFLQELEQEHPFVVAEREMPHNVRLSNISSVFEGQFPKKERQERFVEVLRDAVSQFPWNKFPQFSSLPAVTSIQENIGKPNNEFLSWYTKEYIPTVLGTYLRVLHTFATHGWVTPHNITIVGVPTDLDSVHGPEITESPIEPKRKLKDCSDALESIYILCRAISPENKELAYANFDSAYEKT